MKVMSSTNAMSVLFVGAIIAATNTISLAVDQAALRGGGAEDNMKALSKNDNNAVMELVKEHNSHRELSSNPVITIGISAGTWLSSPTQCGFVSDVAGMKIGGLVPNSYPMFHKAVFEPNTPSDVLWIKEMDTRPGHYKIGGVYVDPSTNERFVCPLFWNGNEGNEKQGQFRCVWAGKKFNMDDGDPFKITNTANINPCSFDLFFGAGHGVKCRFQYSDDLSARDVNGEVTMESQFECGGFGTWIAIYAYSDELHDQQVNTGTLLTTFTAFRI